MVFFVKTRLKASTRERCLCSVITSFFFLFQCGKGRDVGLNQIAAFQAKVASGNGEQCLSRDIYRLGQLFDFFRMLSFFFNSVGFYVTTLVRPPKKNQKEQNHPFFFCGFELISHFFNYLITPKLLVCYMFWCKGLKAPGFMRNLSILPIVGAEEADSGKPFFVECR